MAKQRIAVLGGGAGSLAAVYGLTSQPGWRDRYEITVYQLGWRLGGKAASGRDPSPEGRFANVEHGFHVFGGFYHNAFNMLRQVYAEWVNVPGARAIPFDQAFLPHDLVHYGNQSPDGWGFAPITFPRLAGEIGVGATELTPMAMAACVVAMTREMLASGAHVANAAPTDPAYQPLTLIERLELAPVKTLTYAMDALVEGIEAVRREPLGDLVFDGLIGLIDVAIAAVHGLDTLFPAGKDQLDLLTMAEVGLVCLKGALVDDVPRKGFDVSNDMELLAWLRKYGLSDKGLNSITVRAGYDYTFAYEDGDTSRPNMAAGVALRGLARLMLTYHGSIFWHLNGGMGEIVFTPLYEVLKRRGVDFRFFTRVEALTLSEDLATIDTICGKTQAVPTGDYDPLAIYPALDRKYWPLQPDFDQLRDGDALRPLGPDWESYWVEPPSDTPFTLRRGQDFDLVILGISVGALPEICADLARKLPAWQRMLDSQSAVPTYGIQYWMKPSTADLGWTGGPTILTAYQEPMSTWADMSFLTKLEAAYPDGSKPKSLHYFCGAMPRAAVVPPPPNPAFPRERVEQAKADMAAWLDAVGTNLWPKAGAPGGAPGIDPALIDTTAFKANVFPSELFVLSRAGTIDKRMKAGDSGVSNLFLAGDWIRTGLDAGAFEAAVMGGLQCAAALSNVPLTIYGETDFPKATLAFGDDGTAGLTGGPKPLPDFIEIPGNMIPRLPYVATDALLQGGFVRGDRGKLQAVVDRVLNGPSQGRLTFHVCTALVLVTGLYCPRMTSGDPTDGAKGYAAEGDVGFWTLVLGGPRGNPAAWSLRWLPVYLFVDTGIALASGREVFGYPKALGHFTRGSDQPEDARVAVDTLMFKTFGPNEQARIDTLFRIEAGMAQGGGLLAEIGHWVTQAVNTIAADVDTLAHAALDLTGLKPPLVDMPMIFLKQFRDAAQDGKACYQQVVEVAVESTRLARFGSLGPHRLTFAPSASYPIARDLGLTSGSDLILPFWLIQDFKVGAGTIL